jgi:hypothetical protein
LIPLVAEEDDGEASWLAREDVSGVGGGGGGPGRSVEGVGTSDLPSRTRSGSPKNVRRRASEALIAGWPTDIRSAALVTLLGDQRLEGEQQIQVKSAHLFAAHRGHLRSASHHTASHVDRCG